MFDNIGGKIKTTATVICWIGITISILIGLVRLAEAEENSATAFIGVLIMFVGSLTSWIGSFLLYGFGQLVENSDNLAWYVTKIHEKSTAKPTAINILHQKSGSSRDTLDILRDERIITEEEYIRQKRRAQQQ